MGHLHGETGLWAGRWRMDRTLVGKVKAEGHTPFKGIRINKGLELISAWTGWRVEVCGKGRCWWKKKKSKQKHDTSILCYGGNKTQGINDPVKLGQGCNCGSIVGKLGMPYSEIIHLGTFIWDEVWKRS